DHDAELTLDRSSADITEDVVEAEESLDGPRQLPGTGVEGDGVGRDPIRVGIRGTEATPPDLDPFPGKLALVGRDGEVVTPRLQRGEPAVEVTQAGTGAAMPGRSAG